MRAIILNEKRLDDLFKIYIDRWSYSDPYVATLDKESQKYIKAMENNILCSLTKLHDDLKDSTIL